MVSEIRLAKGSIWEEILDVREGIKSRNSPITRLVSSKEIGNNLGSLFETVGCTYELEEIEGTDTKGSGCPHIRYRLKITVNGK